MKLPRGLERLTGMELNLMAMLRAAALFSLFSAPVLAESWTGTLVDSRCYDNRESNVNPTDTLTYVDRDKNSEIRYCAANTKTKTFEVVLQDGLSLRLDPAGNAKAAELVRMTGKTKSFLFVTVTGERSKGTVTVDSILVAR